MSSQNLDLFAASPPTEADPPSEAPPAPADASGGREAPSVSEPRVWTVGQVNRAVRKLLEQTLPQLWVSGEVANFSRQRSGHCYFTLKDDAAQLRCVMFRRDAQRLPIDPEEGMTLRVFGGLTLYEARGGYQLVVSRLEAEGEDGMWKLAFDRLRRRLDAEGLTDPGRKRRLPPFPRRVGIVTSPTGAALRDIISVVNRRAPWIRLLIRGTRVQGDGAGLEIAHAISTLAAHSVDVIIVARGGGSMEDLWGFNEEPVARAIAGCSVPVVSGVGHEVDVTIADLVADLRAPTPSAAAEAVVPERDALVQVLGGLRRRLGTGLAGQARTRRWKLDRARQGLLRGGRGLGARHRRRLESGRGALAAAFRRRLARNRGSLERLAAAMEALSPLSTLARGYAVPLDADGRLLRTTRDYGVGQGFRLRVVDGSVPCTVAAEPVTETERIERGV